MGEPAIAVTGLHKSCGPKEAVAGIDLEIAAGSFAGLVGPNGAGKTTSLSMMTELLRPDGRQGVMHRLQVGVCPAAATVGTAHPTGMRKKVMLGCALIHNPSALLLDEPLEGVAPVSADVIRRLLTR